ncbi:MAG: GNAT family N-acetyltransferase [Verrucomicrobiota bacterium]
MPIRPASTDDVETILDLIRGIAEYENLTHQLEATTEKLQESLFGENPVAYALVAEDDSSGIVGYAIYFYNFSTFLAQKGIYLEDLYVKPEYRGKGWGKKLFTAVAKIAYDQNCGRMEWMALDWNDPALEFYRAQGASLLEEWRLLRFLRPELEKLLK